MNWGCLLEQAQVRQILGDWLPTGEGKKHASQSRWISNLDVINLVPAVVGRSTKSVMDGDSETKLLA